MNDAVLNNTVVPNPKFLDGVTPTINLGGVKWPIPKMKLRQVIEIAPLLAGAFSGITREMLDNMSPAVVAQVITPQQVNNMSRAVYVALTRAHPDLTWEQFEDFEDVGIDELMFAVPIVAAAVGMEKKGAPKPGEETASN